MISTFIIVGGLLLTWLYYYKHIVHTFFHLYMYLILIIIIINTAFIFVLIFLKKIPALAISWLSLCLLYLSCETTILVFNILGLDFPEIESSWDILGVDGYYNSHCTKWDPFLGHKWVPGTHRIVKFNGNKIILDNLFHVNNQGHISSYDYSYKKKDSFKRYIVFGDSFTDEQLIPHPWPDCCMKKLNENDENNNYELYNFGTHGGGLPAWYYTFFNEIIPKYEFDGIILAVFGDDLARPHYFTHFENGYSYDGTLKFPPKNDLEFKHALSSADSSRCIFPGYQLDSVVNAMLDKKDWSHSKYLRFNWYIFRNLNSSLNIIVANYWWEWFANKFVHTSNSSSITDDYLNAKYSSEKIKQLVDMIEYCKKHDKKFIFVTIPGQLELKACLNGKEIILQKELDYLANKHQVQSYNGYSLFNDIPVDEINSLYLMKDPHWNQYGANMFAYRFAHILSNDLNDSLARD